MAIKELDSSSYEEYGMASLVPSTTNTGLYIELRPQPDTVHKTPSVKVRVTDARFKNDRQNNTVVAVDGSHLAGPVLAPVAMKTLLKWLELNRIPITKYWVDDNYATDQLFSDLKRL